MSEIISSEEQLIAELELLGIHYISRQSTYSANYVRPYPALFADLIQQSSSRIRNALIAVLLIHPEAAQEIPKVLDLLDPAQQFNIKLLYTAAVALQKEYAQLLNKYFGKKWLWLPNLFSEELDIPDSLPAKEIISILGKKHSQYKKIYLNWEGTYRNVVDHLIRQWEVETQWQR